jgi:hypothetical protein
MFRRRSGIQRNSAQSRPTASPYALEIMDGQLSLVNLTESVNVAKRWGPGKTDRVEATLVNIIDVLRDMHADANIAMSPELANIQIADLKLRATSLDEELEALRVASGSQFIWTKPSASVGAVDPTTGLSVAAVPASEFTLYSLVPAEFGGPGPTKRNVEVFNLGAYLQHQKDPQASIREIEEIILATLRQLKPDNRMSGEDPSYQFHSGANLLIVIGRQDALDVARRVVMALQEEARGGGFASLPQPPPPTQIIPPPAMLPQRTLRVPERKVRGADLQPGQPLSPQTASPGANTNR